MDPGGAVLPPNCKHWLHLRPHLKPECNTSALLSCFTNIPNYIHLGRSNEGGYVLFAPALKVDALIVLTSLQTLHMGLIGWTSCNSTLQTNSQTSIFKMSPLRFNSFILAASFCLRQLSVSTWLESITINTMEMQAGLTPVAFFWRPGVFRWMEVLC